MLKEQPFDIVSLHAAYRDGLDPATVVDESYRRLQVAEDSGIFLHLIDPDTAKREAQSLGAFDPINKPLWGIPFAIKDNIDALDIPTSAACPEYAYMADKDAFAVDLLRRAGAILIGKTNLDQFATGLVGVRSPYAPPRNAIDPEIVPGGSSSGSSVAVSHGIVSFSLGTDTAGSGRVPAALNNIVGLKPSLGALSNTGVVPACRTLDTVSIFALTVDDAYRAYRVAAKFDASDSYARPITAPALGLTPPTFRVGAPSQDTRIFYGDSIQSASFEDSLQQITSLGGDLVEIDFSAFFDVASMLYDGPWVAERYAVIKDFMEAHPNAVHPVTQRVISTARNYTAADVFQAFYRLQDLKRQTDLLLDQVDFLCVPSIPKFVSLKEIESDSIGPNAQLGVYTNFVNLLDLCAITAPVTARTDGRPGSVTLIARRGRDALIAGVSRDLQLKCAAPLGATKWLAPKIDAATKPVAGAGEMEIAVVGAHMSGLPLNRELTNLGARYLYACSTAPSYRLFSLPGGAPARPGLVFDPVGAAIDLEVWALPMKYVGAFLTGIPRPLGIGSVILEDGAAVKGFLCESNGTEGAEDVTRFGGWRAFLQHQSTQGQPSQDQPPQHQPKEPTDA
jgi:allophanate hydrolase